MRGFRAKDSDRDHFVELIEAAYVDGQLGAADRDLRVSRALSAETLDELQTLTRDLQPPPGGLPAAPLRTASHPRRLLGVVLLLGAVVAMLGVGVASLVLFASVDTGSDASPSVGVESAPAEPQVDVEPFSLDRRGLRRFVRAYQSTFGRSDVVEAVIGPDRVEVEAPVGGSGRVERWYWDGEWRQVSAASRATASAGIDLRTLDIRRLVANVSTAERTVGIDGAALAFATVTSAAGTTVIDIYVRNDRAELGYLRTTPSGDVMGRYRIRQ